MDASTRTPPQADFEALMAPHLQPLAALAWRFTHNAATAQDLYQDTLLKAYRFFHRFETGTNLWGWLFTMMRNLYFSRARQQARAPTLVDLDHLPRRVELSLVDAPPVVSPETLTEALPHVVTDEVLEALNDLPDAYRLTVLLADVLDYTYQDIADFLGCPLGTVMSRLHRGRQLLQKRLLDYARDQGYVRGLNSHDHTAPVADAEHARYAD